LLGQPAHLAGAKPSGWRVLVAANLEQARLLLAREEIPVVLCEPCAAGMDWRCAIALLAATPSHPSIVLLTPAWPRPAWKEVTAAGGYEVMAEPWNAEALERTMRSARADWHSRRELESAPRARG
jgi:hypothetical protein